MCYLKRFWQVHIKSDAGTNTWFVSMQTWFALNRWRHNQTDSRVGLESVRNNVKSRIHNLCKSVKRNMMFQNLVRINVIYVLCSMLQRLFYAYWSCWYLPSQHVVGSFSVFYWYHTMEFIYSKDHVSTTFMHVRRAFCCCCCCFGMGFFLVVFTSERNLN